MDPRASAGGVSMHIKHDGDRGDARATIEKDQEETANE
jgi:hypothetical protein